MLVVFVSVWSLKYPVPPWPQPPPPHPPPQPPPSPQPSRPPANIPVPNPGPESLLPLWWLWPGPPGITVTCPGGGGRPRYWPGPPGGWGYTDLGCCGYPREGCWCVWYCGGGGRVETIAVIHSSTSFSDFVANQKTSFFGLLPTASIYRQTRGTVNTFLIIWLTWLMVTPGGGLGRPGTRAVCWPAAMRSGLWLVNCQNARLWLVSGPHLSPSLTPPLISAPRWSVYQANTPSPHNTSHTSSHPLVNKPSGDYKCQTILKTCWVNRSFSNDFHLCILARIQLLFEQPTLEQIEFWTCQNQTLDPRCPGHDTKVWRVVGYYPRQEGPRRSTNPSYCANICCQPLYFHF